MKSLGKVLLSAAAITLFMAPGVMAADLVVPDKAEGAAKQGTWRCGKGLYFQHGHGQTYSYAYLSSGRGWILAYDDRTENSLQGAVDTYNWVCLYYTSTSTYSHTRSYYY